MPLGLACGRHLAIWTPGHSAHTSTAWCVDGHEFSPITMVHDARPDVVVAAVSPDVGGSDARIDVTPTVTSSSPRSRVRGPLFARCADDPYQGHRCVLDRRVPRRFLTALEGLAARLGQCVAERETDLGTSARLWLAPAESELGGSLHQARPGATARVRSHTRLPRASD